MSSTTRSGEQRKPLSEWIRSAEKLHDYLIPALRIASSLADQICKAEEAGQSPTSSSNWIDYIVVRVQSNNSEDGRFDGKKAAAEEGEEDGVGMENVFDAILADGERTTKIDERADEDGEGGSSIRAEMLPHLFNTTEDKSRQASHRILYSLGLVFYEIFSGGERPAELEQKQLGGEKPPIGPQYQTGTKELAEGLDPLPFDQGCAINLEGELSIFDDLLDDYDLVGDESIYDDITSQDQGPMKKRTQHEQHNICSVSIEPLKAKGLPRALCDLVASMVDCVYGIISKDETYRTMAEVRDDLQLMLDKPAIYLHDQDMGRLSTTGLQFGGTVFGRKTELSTIIDAYRRSSSGEKELVTLSGQSGTGKSLLAYEFGKYVISTGGIFLSGKFDQLQQGKPFSALASAFNQYCGILLQTCDLKLKLTHQVNHVMGREAYHLAKLIPNLALILGLEMRSNNVNHDEGCINAQKRLQYLLCKFVEVISNSFATPVTFFLDDLQWADPASIAAANQLLLNGGPASQNKRFFFLGCYREGEINSNPLWGVICNNDLLDARSTKIKLDCMNKETLNRMVSETLCLSPRLTRSLSSIIYHKTKGNPLFVSRLMLSLSKEGLLRPSLSRRRWEWDKARIQCQKLPDDVAEFLMRSIEALSDDVKSSICVLSCFGASRDREFIKTLERSLQMDLLDNLDVAVQEGLLDKTDDQYRFSHDRIQEAAYNIIGYLDRCRFHFSYGMALAPLAAGEEDGSILFAAVSQLNLAGPEAVQDESQNNIIVANLNLRAGKKAMEMSDFVAAYTYFDNGISFLRKNHWKEHYALSLELFDLAAECAHTNGDIVSLQLLCEQVLTYGRSFRDQLNVMYVFTCALAFSARLPEAIEKGLDILSKLGIDLGDLGSSMEVCAQETKYLLSSYTDDEILNTRRMTDTTMIMAMKFLGKLELGMTQIMPKSVPHVTQQIIQLSLDHGLSPVSPIGFVHFGSYMAKLGDIRGGYHYVKLAFSLLDKVGSRESAGEVICIGTQVRAYVEPLQAALEYHTEGYKAAMASGDIIQAALNSMLGCGNSIYAGTNLQIMQEKCAEVMKFMEERKLVIFMFQMQYFMHSVLKLIGIDEESKQVSAEEQSILATNNSVMTSYFYQKAYTSFMFRSYDGTKDNTEKYLACIGHTWANLFLHFAFHSFYIGLISFWLARKSTDGQQQQQQWYERGKSSKVALQKWAASSLWTFENKWFLLEAEDACCNNDVEAAKTYYDKAISSAKDHKFLNEEALAGELAAYFYWEELGQKQKAMELFLLAHEKYHEWGAFGKCTSLFEFVGSNFTSSSSVGSGLTSTNSAAPSVEDALLSSMEDALR